MADVFRLTDPTPQEAPLVCPDCRESFGTVRVDMSSGHAQVAIRADQLAAYEFHRLSNHSTDEEGEV